MTETVRVVCGSGSVAARVRLYADIFKPTGYAIDRCSWTGGNYAGAGEGDPDNHCRWVYTPKTGLGPARGVST